MIKLYGKPIRCNKATTERGQELDVGANLFIGNLDPEVDEKILYDTFSSFGNLHQPKVIDGCNRQYRYQEIRIPGLVKGVGLYLMIRL